MQKRSFFIAVLTVFSLFTLAGCVSNDMDDLEQYIADVKARKNTSVRPLPEVKPYERYLYQSLDQGLRDPFLPLFGDQVDTVVSTVDTVKQKIYLREINERNPEELEAFELDSLRMVGTLDKGGTLWAIVLDPNGMVHRVTKGNYMGKNYGRVLSVGEENIHMREIVKDVQGAFEERKAGIGLSDEDG